MTIECVTIESCHNFSGNPLAEQHRLRYRSIIQRQDWDMPHINNMEYDQYDTPATTYLVWRDSLGIARGSSRLCKTDRAFMLQEHFSQFVTYQDMPSGIDTLEGSRFCIDKTMDIYERQRIAHEIVIAYLEYGISNGIKRIIGIMYPTYLQNLFANNGWQPVWLGETLKTPDGKKSRAAILPVNQGILDNVRARTGIYQQIINYGTKEEKKYVQAA